MELAEFEYHLPPEAIAQTPLEPRDSSRLLNTRDMSDHRFSELGALLDAGDLLVFNTTRVRPARLRGQRADTGGTVELLLLDRLSPGRWRALVSPARRSRPGVRYQCGPAQLEVVEGPVDGVVTVEVDDETQLAAAGSVPLPPYIHTELEDGERYQTIYADVEGSAAAPTAGLHFTERVLSDLEEQGIRRAVVELRVGLDTFRPITVPRIEDHVMHREWCSLPEGTAEAIRDTRSRGGRVVAVGTTTVRTLETFGREDGTVDAGTAETDLFLRPGSVFQVVDAMVTNFHVPGSSLLVMLAAFMGDAWREAYATALQRGYRFLSFGDAMLCERQP